MEQINLLRDEIDKALSTAGTSEELENLRIGYLGKKGKLTASLKSLAALDVETRKEAGKALNDLKDWLSEAINQKKNGLAGRLLEEKLAREWTDITVPLPAKRSGTLHPISRIQYEIEDIFSSLGFMILDGPWAEDDWHNFQALNIPLDHPARDMQDTFWLSNGKLLRTHTSCVQVRAMEKFKPPLRVIAPGRVFRYEATDASHENTFYQVEGLMVDKGISVAHLIYTMKTLLRHVFGRDVKVRLRPGFFPFVEPGFELDINCLICGGSGCPVCKQSGWVELLPCGLVHPNVLKHGKIDPEIYSGFAFGLGLNRLVMMRYGINDIRYFQNPDLRFLSQF